MGLGLGLGLGLPTAVQANADTVRIGSWDRKTDALTLVNEAILMQAYAELKQPVEFVDLPVRRAMQMMLNRELDGNVHRMADLALTQPSLYRVATPICVSEVRVYAMDPKFQPSNWSQLKGLRVAFMRGTLLIERKLPAGSQRLEASSLHEMFRLLQAGIADVILVTEPAQLDPNPLAIGVGAVRLEAVLERTPLHHYLLNSHRELGERIDGVLKRLEANGETRAIKARVMSASR
jgi:ABC-type amino acid transport substrate-binding protein